MKNIHLLTLTMLAIPTLSYAQDMTTKFIDTKGDDVGTATLVSGSNGTMINLDLQRLPAGEHAIHIHDKADCTPLASGANTNPKDYFANAGGHFNPQKHDHGFMQEKGPHAGDIPNIIIPESGSLKTQMFNERVTLNATDNAKLPQLLDDDGAALIIHAGPDDHTSQPSGAAGDRIACAPIKAQ